MHSIRRKIPKYPVALAIATWCLASSARAQLCLPSTARAFPSVANIEEVSSKPGREFMAQAPSADMGWSEFSSTEKTPWLTEPTTPSRPIPAQLLFGVSEAALTATPLVVDPRKPAQSSLRIQLRTE